MKNLESMRHYWTNLLMNIYKKNSLLGSNIQYSVTVCINSIWNNTNSSWQTKYHSYLIFTLVLYLQVSLRDSSPPRSSTRVGLYLNIFSVSLIILNELSCHTNSLTNTIKLLCNTTQSLDDSSLPRDEYRKCSTRVSSSLACKQ